MVALYNTESEMKIELNVYQIVFGQNRKTSQARRVPNGNLIFFIDHLTQIEQLMVAGMKSQSL